MHSLSGMPELIWMLSIQMCPLVPCAKKPSITTWGRGMNEGNKGRSRQEEDKKIGMGVRGGERMKS